MALVLFQLFFFLTIQVPRAFAQNPHIASSLPAHGIAPYADPTIIINRIQARHGISTAGRLVLLERIERSGLLVPSRNDKGYTGPTPRLAPAYSPTHPSAPCLIPEFGLLLSAESRCGKIVGETCITSDMFPYSPVYFLSSVDKTIKE